ncbi:MAG: TlpA family protein disulfide reductase [Clostridia bacterium]|nr:TlpA family protein disulfide reductase [Clostridia bacterium]
MNRFKAAISLILVCAMLFVVGACAKKQTETTVSANKVEKSAALEEQTPIPQGAAEGERAPDFIAHLTNGDTFRLSEHEDEVILLNFWATWCPPCVGELPELEKLYKDNMDGVQILTVNCGESESVVDDFLKENSYSLPVSYDTNNTISFLYSAQGIPYTLIISGGIVQKAFIGVPQHPYEAYKGAIEECM